MQMYINLNDRIRLLRKNKGLTQKELAGFLHITEQTENKYEMGRRIPDADVLNRMVNILDCEDPGWLLTGNEQKKAITDEEQFMSQWPEEIQNACRQLKEILLSDHRLIKPALLSNLAAFEGSINEEKKTRCGDPGSE
jgi:transcriptional regulator with XRE-family HTH domain